MRDRRLQPRLLCADLVDVEWRDEHGRPQQAIANLEDISLSGACLQLDEPIPLNTCVLIRHAKGLLAGDVRYCVYREIGYFLGIQFRRGSSWSRKQFRPQHLFDPRRLVMRPLQKNGGRHTPALELP